MHPTILVQRRARAFNRFVEHATVYAKKNNLDPALVQNLTITGVRDPAVADMMRFEAMAEFMAKVTGDKKAEAEPPEVNEFIVSREVLAQAEAEVAPPPPAPVEEPTEEDKPRRRKKK